MLFYYLVALSLLLVLIALSELLYVIILASFLMPWLFLVYFIFLYLVFILLLYKYVAFFKVSLCTYFYGKFHAVFMRSYWIWIIQCHFIVSAITLMTYPMFYHIQKNNATTHLFPEILATCYFKELWACPNIGATTN